ncbi:hypothetical protein T484DRAFT_1948741 [Baffinella frigidus]|nr:hypothetical protein T484DRAFT_1948741 [Cryptophyta sp. CCMP2293]
MPPRRKLERSRNTNLLRELTPASRLPFPSSALAFPPSPLSFLPTPAFSPCPARAPPSCPSTPEPRGVKAAPTSATISATATTAPASERATIPRSPGTRPARVLLFSLCSLSFASPEDHAAFLASSTCPLFAPSPPAAGEPGASTATLAQSSSGAATPPPTHPSPCHAAPPASAPVSASAAAPPDRCSAAAATRSARLSRPRRASLRAAGTVLRAPHPCSDQSTSPAKPTNDRTSDASSAGTAPRETATTSLPPLETSTSVPPLPAAPASSPRRRVGCAGASPGGAACGSGARSVTGAVSAAPWVGPDAWAWRDSACAGEGGAARRGRGAAGSSATDGAPPPPPPALPS